MPDQQFERLQAINAKIGRLYEQLSRLELWQHTTRLELLDQYEAALKESLEIIGDYC